MKNKLENSKQIIMSQFYQVLGCSNLGSMFQVRYFYGINFAGFEQYGNERHQTKNDDGNYAQGGSCLQERSSFITQFFSRVLTNIFIAQKNN